MIVVGVYIAKTNPKLFTADLTTYRADSTIITTDKYTSNETIDTYNRLDLFNDETISITSAIQDVNDISKTKTDFSQSFTVPANNNNNSILSHWYDNGVDNGFNALKRKEAYVTLDTKVFRVGKMQLEKAEIKDSLPQSYTLTFFGSLVSLKDTFNGLLLKDLNTGEFDFNYTSTDVRTKVTTQTTSDIKFPLITSLRQWNYGKTGVDDISLAAGTINYGELFPALRLRKVLKLIENKFNITFTGTFVDSDSKFLNAYLLLKNSEVFKPRGQLQKINYQTQTGTANGITFNLATDILDFTTLDASYDAAVRTVTLNITTAVAGINYSVFCFKDGVQVTKADATSIVGTQSILMFTKNGVSSDTGYDFYLSSESPISFTSTGTLYSQFRVGGMSLVVTTSTITQSTSQNTASVLAVAAYMPDQKIEDFFSGVLKMFNLACYSEIAGVYILEQLENFYSSGNTIDLTKYLITDKKEIERTKPYNKINFQHEKSESINSVNFLSSSRIAYGDIQAEFDVNGSGYDLKVPFENPLFSGLTKNISFRTAADTTTIRADSTNVRADADILNTNLSVGFLTKTDLKPYIPKPIILYDYGVLASVSTYYFNGTAATKYNAFGAETAINGSTYSLNFNNEQSPMTNTLIPNSLYSQYYQNYLNNIYSVKGRIIKVDVILPPSYLTSSSTTCLKLNSKIIINGKRYIINSFNTNLISGVVALDLMTDFRTAI